jgi:hypothetical protein
VGATDPKFIEIKVSSWQDNNDVSEGVLYQGPVR